MKARKVGSTPVAVDVDEPRQPHAAEPQVALLLAGADDEVGDGALAEHGLRRAACGALLALADRLEDLDHLRVVEVGHEADGQASDVAQELGREPLGDDDVVAAHGVEERLEVGEPGLEQRHRRVADVAGPRGRERDLAVRRERARQLERPDRRARHRGPDGLGGDDEHAHGAAAYGARPRSRAAQPAGRPRRRKKYFGSTWPWSSSQR